MPPQEQIEDVLNLWQEGMSAAEIGKRYGQSRDWARRIVRKAAKAGDPRAVAHLWGRIFPPAVRFMPDLIWRSV
jgi:transposase